MEGEVEDIAIEKLGIEEQLDKGEDEKYLEKKRSVRKSTRSIRFRPLEKIEECYQVVTRSKKWNISSLKDIENYYLDKKVKLNSLALETIFEDPQNNNTMSTKKLKRSIQFSAFVGQKVEKSKVKKRSRKAKKLEFVGFKKLPKKVGLNLLMSKLQELDNEFGITED
ncbi:uncharacterized protein [Euwallacea similis]|uniref:uncharacterized protein n=1 Tax=Euwallacea similis TaxID=1736056 RepID=UPI00344B8E51